ncbi:MAG: YlxM family DNA-binding protein [Bacillota bacterium]
MFDKILHITLLYDFYGQLLTPKQQEIVQQYYHHDFSLGEISEQLNISRQAVYDTIKRTEKILLDYEDKLGLIQKFNKNRNDIEKIISIIDSTTNKEYNALLDSKELLKALSDIKEIAENIIER